VETLTRDVDASIRFYEAVFGWTASTTDDGGHRYTTFFLDGEEIAGLLEMPPQVPPEAPAHWAVYFAVEDCEVTERGAVDLGGSVLVETRPVEIGRFAVLEDPAGATFDIMDFSDASQSMRV
jgi:predicted enzyme related to lactoylglutathione lyase